MILSDRDIKKLVEEENAVYVLDGEKPIDLSLQLGPSSMDLRLGEEFVIFHRHKIQAIDVTNLKNGFKDISEKVKVTREEGFVIHPGEFCLGTTVEHVKIPTRYVVRMEGRSSWGRIGLIVHATAGYVDPGFEGQLTLELHNVSPYPIVLRPLERICQIVFEKMNSEPEIPYSKKKDSKYSNQRSATESRIHKEIR